VSDPRQSADRLAIAELYARYNWAVDSADGAQFAACFIDDGAFIGSAGEMRGRETLTRFATDEALDRRGVMHFTGNLVIDFETPDEAQGRAYMMALLPDSAGLKIERAGRYRDRLIRSSAGWHFIERRFGRLPEPQT
jgi:hypothetical protein